MTFARKATIAGLIAALAATSSLAFAQSGNDASSAPDTTVVEPRSGDMPGMRGPGRSAGRMMERLDTDNSGDISAAEFSERRLGWLSEADDGDGVLSIEEITAAMEQRRQERREARLMRRFDIDGDGEITLEELETQQEKRFALLDRDNDGTLQRDEMRRGGRHGGHGKHHGMRHGPRGGGMGGHHGGGWQ